MLPRTELLLSASAKDALEYIDDCRFALDHLFVALGDQLEVMRRRKEELEELRKAEAALCSKFVGQDQWKSDANERFVEYMAHVRAIDDKRNVVNFDSALRSNLLLELTAAREDSIATLAGAILQIGKQALSFRFGKKPDLPSARRVGSQSVIELIWEGRNHALHWEDEKAWEPPVKPQVKMLRALSLESQAWIASNGCGNNALIVLDALGWRNTVAVVQDLRSIVE